ncbi:Nuf2 family-domain-containing protein [Thamnocephalis sphaerospora]|uniref:Nuf2 family-domain-containing protein n=1 Tax=Thamnocephalis sphaerospora TaxID=78915 RepID=A0A4P9XG22_9FUNG|nr:Nuf2 family-domain-containing protein [Thamnocephalis sphaerospora]|eukprot:RKP04575.1 Nuf2 family-domain-containing protein [Thamnocephalis sphaerospora]
MDYGPRHNGQQSKGSFIFPTLKNQEIVECMEDMQIPFTSEDLQRPTQSRMQTVYEQFCDVLMGVTREEIEAVDGSALDLEYADIYQDSLVLMSFYRQLLRIMLVVGVEDFSFRDLVKPEPGRVRRIMSAIINFVKFREERMVVLEQYTAKSARTIARRPEEYADQLVMLQQQNQDLAQRLQNLRIQRQQEEPVVQKIKEANAEIHAELRDLKKRQSALTADIEQLKKEKSELSDKLAITQVQARIVHSPEKLRKVIEELNDQLADAKQGVGDKERRARELQTRIEMFQAVEELGNDREQIEQKRLQIRELEIKEQVKTAEDKIERLHKSQQQRRDVVARKVGELNQDYARLQHERDETQRKINSQKQIVEEKEQQSLELRRHMEQEMSAIQSEYTRLRNQVESYQDELLRAIVVPGGVFR